MSVTDVTAPDRRRSRRSWPALPRPGRRPRRRSPTRSGCHRGRQPRRLRTGRLQRLDRGRQRRRRWPWSRRPRSTSGCPTSGAAPTRPRGWTAPAWSSVVYKNLGYDLPRVSYQQAAAGRPVASMAEAQPGDLLAWDNSSRNNGVDHIAIYIGGGKMIEAPRTGLNIRIIDVPYHPGRDPPDPARRRRRAPTSASRPRHRQPHFSGRPGQRRHAVRRPVRRRLRAVRRTRAAALGRGQAGVRLRPVGSQPGRRAGPDAADARRPPRASASPTPSTPARPSTARRAC